MFCGCIAIVSRIPTRAGTGEAKSWPQLHYSTEYPNKQFWNEESPKEKQAERFNEELKLHDLILPVVPGHAGDLSAWVVASKLPTSGGCEPLAMVGGLLVRLCVGVSCGCTMPD